TAQDVAQELFQLWIQRLARLMIQVVIDGGSQRVGAVLDVIESEFDVWTAIFGGNGERLGLRSQVENSCVSNAVRVFTEVCHEPLASSFERAIGIGLIGVLA